MSRLRSRISIKRDKRVSSKRYNRVQHLWRFHKSKRVRKKNYNILTGICVSLKN